MSRLPHVLWFPKAMLTDHLAQAIYIVLLVATLSSVLAGTTSIAPPCFRYSFSEIYTLDEASIPDGVSVREYSNVDGSTHFFYLTNTSPNILMLTGGLLIKLVDGREFTRSFSSGGRWTERDPKVSYAKLNALTRIGDSSRSTIPNTDTYSSNDVPNLPEPVHFEIPATYSGQPITIAGILSYKLQERDCQSK